MSYCRFSSDNWRCDVYVYESDRGFVTHVAGNRVVGTIPNEPPWSLLDEPGGAVQFGKEHSLVMEFLATAGREPIGGPWDGDSFLDADLSGLRVRLAMLRGGGYNVPQYVLKPFVRGQVKPEAGDVVAGSVAFVRGGSWGDAAVTKDGGAK